jgi:hypothetical protein
MSLSFDASEISPFWMFASLGTTPRLDRLRLSSESAPLTQGYGRGGGTRVVCGRSGCLARRSAHDQPAAVGSVLVEQSKAATERRQKISASRQRLLRGLLLRQLDQRDSIVVWQLT